MLSLAPFQSKAAGLPDLLNYALLVDEGIVQGKDGSFIAGFFFRGDDAASASNAERNHVTALVATYLARFGSGWCMWVDAMRLHAPGYPAPSESHFPDPISALIDAERRELFERENTFFETEYALILQFRPLSETEKKVKKWLYDDSRSAINESGLEDFKKMIADFQSGLGDPLNMRRMGTVRTGSADDQYDSDQLVNYLHYALYGETIALRIPACPMYLDSWLGMRPLWVGNTLKLGDKFISCVSIEGYPAYSCPGVLSLLDTLQISYRWSSRFIFLDQEQAVHGIQQFRRFWNQTVKSLWSVVFRTEGVINLDSLKMTKEAELALADVKSGAVGFGYYTTVVVLMNEDQKVLQEQARYIWKEIQKKGFAARVEEENTQEAWNGSLPGHYRPNVRRALIHTLNLADLLPLSGIWSGLPENPCEFYPEGSSPLMRTVTTGATPFNLNLHVGDVGHSLILGPTGAGKSTLLALILAQFGRYQSRPRPDGSSVPATVTAFDKGGSLYALCSAVSGRHYDIGADYENGLMLCPLADINDDSGVLWAQEWVGTCYELQVGQRLNPNQKQEVHQSLILLRSSPNRSLTNFLNNVQDQKITDALSHYSLNGGMGRILDGDEDAFTVSNFTVFEIDELMKLGDRNAIPVLLYLFRKFEKSLTGQPSVLALDEAWVMLGHPVFREKLREWLKELRKKNCAVILATQSLSDAVRSGLLDVLIEQCQTKIFLPNMEADLRGTAENPGPADFYEKFGFNPREIDLLKYGEYKKQYYYKSPLGRRMFELALGPLALSFVGVSDKDSIREIKAMEKEFGRDWPVQWMKKRGVDYVRYL